MVALDIVKASNATIAKDLPPGLIAVVTGGTSGIGEATLKALAKYAIRPRIYIVGRSLESAERIIAECRTLNADGEYIFIQKSLWLLKDVNELCDDLAKREKHINILVLSAGEVDLSTELTEDGIRPLMALALYGRILAAYRLLPLLQAAPNLRRVITVAGGGYEGQIDPEDWQANKVGRNAIRAQLSMMGTLAFQELAKKAPEVSFIQEFPGLVITKLFNSIPGLLGIVARVLLPLIGRFLEVPIDECGERHAFMATSSSFAPAIGDANGLSLVAGLESHKGVDGEESSGVYSVGWDNEGPEKKVVALVDQYRRDGMAEKVWQHMQGIFENVGKARS